MFNNILSQFTNSIANRSSEASETSETNGVDQLVKTSKPKSYNKRSRASISFDSSPEQDLKRLRDRTSEEESCESGTDIEETKSAPDMDEERFANLMKDLLKESEERMISLLTSKLKPLDLILNKIDQVETTVVNLQRDAQKLQQDNKRNNIIVYGIEETKDEKAAKIHDVIEGLSNSLNIARIDYDDAFRLGKHQPNKTRPLLIKLLRYRDKQNIFLAAKNLKGTSISISNDKTKETRIAEAALRKKRAEIQKINPRAHVTIRNQKLTIKEGPNTSTLFYDSATNDVMEEAGAEQMQ
jgi:hypothetical protein